VSSKTYIICWDKSFENCIDIHSQLVDSSVDYVIYNVSKTDVELKNWERVPDTRYYSHFYRALKDFVASKHDVFIFNAGDVEYPSYALYTKHIEYLFDRDKNIGAYAPRLTHDVFSGKGSYIAGSKIHYGLVLSTHTNGIYTSLSRDVAEFMFSFMEWAKRNDLTDWKSIISGWGLDTAYCAYVISRGKKIYRDAQTIMLHQEGTSYNEEKATNEMNFVMNEFKNFCFYKKINPEDIQKIYDILYDKVRTRRDVDVLELYSEGVVY
jgi:hypothetical protein